MTMAYYAEVVDAEVVRVVVCDDPQWLTDRLGGVWVETADPYTDVPQDVTYCGPGWKYDPAWSVRFAVPWTMPTPDLETGAYGYRVGAIVAHGGQFWVSTTPSNVWEPGTAAWRAVPSEPGVPPPWQQPSGSTDAYRIHVDAEGAAHPEQVTFEGAVYETTIDNNVWSPTGYPAGWRQVT